MSYSMYKISGTEETLISSDCNPETSKGPTNSSDLYILNGKLYYNGSQVGTKTNWTCAGELVSITNIGEQSSIFWGICDGELYSFSGVDTPSPEKISDTVDWVSVTGKIIYLLYLQDDIYYAYALRSGGQLYSLSYNNTYETVDVARVTISGQAIDGFTCVKGVSILSEDKAECCLAISDGKLYAVLGSYANQVGSVTGWTSVSDCDSNYGFGICDGKLYQIMTTGTPTGGIVGVDTNPSGMAMQVGSRTGWTKISGRKSTSEYPIGICDGKLYRIAVNDVTQIGTESEWTHIGGYCSETGTTGYGICGGKLYAIGYNSVTQIGTEDDWMYLSESGTIAIRGSDGTGGGGEEPGGGGDIPTDGLVFYAPLAESKATAETGQTLNVTGSISYHSIDGIPCAYFNGESYLSGDDSAFPTGSEPFTVSCFVFVSTKTSSMYPSIFHWGLNQVGKAFEIHIYSQDDNIFGEILSYKGVSSGYENKLFHVTVTSTGNSLKIYYNGVLKNSMDIVPSNYNIVNSIFYIGTGNNRGTFYPFNGYVSSVRVYNRVLSESEISALANEFNQSGGGGDDSGTTGFLLNGLFLSSSKPKLGQKGLLLDNKYFLPLVEGGGGSAEYYKCASVDKSAKTWTGYKAVLNDGIYTFESNVTTGLVYTSITPVIGNIYSTDALAKVSSLYQGIPLDGLVFYAPLAESKATAETGQTLNVTGSISYQSIDGIPCAYFDSSSIETKNNFTEISGSNSTFTASIWGCMPNGYNGVQTLLFFGGDDGNGCVLFAMNDQLLVTNIGSDLGYIYLDVQNWFHLLATYNGSNFNLYINGNYVAGPSSFSTRMRIGKLCIGRWNRTDPSYFYGYLSSARIYNRVLTQEEISALANEFNQSGGGGDDSGTTGFLLNGLFLSSSKPKLGQKGLLLDNKYFLPLVEGGGGSAEYYKCASVDKSAKTWTGYKAVLNDGIYTFESNVTTGLAYTSVTPVVGNIYSTDALAKVSSLYQEIPLDGLVFYAPLAESKTTTETGEIIEEYNAEYTVKNGVPCFHSTQNGYLKIRNLEEFRNAYNAGTFSCSFFSMFESGSPRTGFTFIGSHNRSTNPLAAGSTALAQADDSIWEAPEYTNEMIHVVFTSSQYSLKVYVNGVRAGEGSLYTPSIIETNALTIGALPAGWYIDNAPDVEKYIGYMGAVRFYNRSLEESEISALANEFNVAGGQ